jgi:hypothetical protein
MPADNSSTDGKTSHCPCNSKTPTSEQMDTIRTNTDQTCINNNQTSELETPETDPATESVNTDDSSSHNPVRRPGTETATNPLQPPFTDNEPNASGVKCPSNELASESAAE